MRKSDDEMSRSMAEEQDFDTAINWAARQMLGGLNAAEHKELDDWLAQDPKRRELFGEAIDVWRAPETALAAALVEESSYENKGTSRNNLLSSFWRNWRIAVPIGGVLAAAAIALAIGPMLSPPLPPSDAVQIAQAPSDQTSSVLLEDGSKVTLERKARISFDNAGAVRTATLEAGEAFFSIAKDKERPFVLDAGDAQIRVLGTQFNVNTWDQGISVTVLEGRVSFRDKSSQKIVELTAGQGANILNNRSIQTFEFDVSTYADWRTGWVDAVDMPLNEVMAKLERYSDSTISVENAEIDQFLVTGRFQLSQTDSTLRTLALLYGLQIENTPGQIVLSSDKSK